MSVKHYIIYTALCCNLTADPVAKLHNLLLAVAVAIIDLMLLVKESYGLYIFSVRPLWEMLNTTLVIVILYPLLQNVIAPIP